jgi:hypothetical protein
MASVPPAIRVLVGVIAADAGRARAETLLMIVGAWGAADLLTHVGRQPCGLTARS